MAPSFFFAFRTVDLYFDAYLSLLSFFAMKTAIIIEGESNMSVLVGLDGHVTICFAFCVSQCFFVREPSFPYLNLSG